MQMRHASGLLFVDQIRVPTRSTARFAKARFHFSGLEGGPDNCYAGDAGDLGDLGLWMLERTV